jgi:hypothetical protein
MACPPLQIIRASDIYHSDHCKIPQLLTGTDASDDRRSRIQSKSGQKRRSTLHTELLCSNVDHCARYGLIQRLAPQCELIIDVIAFAFFCVLDDAISGTCLGPAALSRNRNC